MRRFLAACLLVVLLCLAACSSNILGGVTERTPEPFAEGLLEPVPPSGGEVPFGEVVCTLYYHYKQTSLMAPKTVRLKPSANITIEQAVVEQLIAGPGADPYGLTATIHPDTRVISVQESHGFLSITLSREFLKIPGETTPWKDPSDYYNDGDLLSRRMAVFSIINSITELGTHSRVLIQVDADGSGANERIKRKEAGFSTQGDQPIEPLSRDAALIFTAERTLRGALDALKEKNWEQLDGYIASSDVDGTVSPSREELADRFGIRMSLVEYTLPGSLEGMTVMEDGSQATICLPECVFIGGSGQTVRYENISLRLVRDPDIWRIAYASMDAMLPVATQ